MAVELNTKAPAIEHPVSSEESSRFDSPLLGIVDSIISTEAPQHQVPYQQLICTEEDRAGINRLISVMGTTGLVQLVVWHQIELILIGKNIAHVHPLKFLSVIFTDPQLVNYLTSLQPTLKWPILMYGLHKGLQIEHERGRIIPLLEDFAREIEIDPANLMEFVQTQQWEQLIRFIAKFKT